MTGWLTGWDYRKSFPLTAQGSDAGTVAVTNGSATVTGTSTVFTEWGAGDQIQLPDSNWYTISAIASDTSLTISENYPGANASGESYSLRLINYQVKITVHRSAGSDSGSDVYVGTNCEADYDDIRFTTSDGETLLDYWIEKGADSSSATIWVEFDSIGTNATTFYMYYGNAGASAVSDGDAAFIIFDDFLGSSLDTDKWYNNTNYQDTLAIADSQAQFTIVDVTARTSPALDSKTQINVPCAVEASLKLNANGSTSAGVSCVLALAAHETSQAYYESDSNYFLAAHFWYGAEATNWRNQIGTKAGSTYDTDLEDDTWIRGSYQFLSGANKQYRNGALELSDSHESSMSVGYFGIHYYSNGSYAIGNQYIYVDWVAVRKLVANEPEFGAWGDEEPEPTTAAPTTLAPTTLAPTTLAPTTLPPTTLAPTTLPPTTLAPTTLPTTSAPTTLAPTTLAPTTLAPTTLPPTTIAPTTLEPTTLAPTTLPTTSAPTTEAPTTLSPTSLAPTTLSPTTLSPTTLAPTTLPPTTAAPTTVLPTTVTPTTPSPTTLPPTTLAPTTAPPMDPVCSIIGYSLIELEIEKDSIITIEVTLYSTMTMELEIDASLCE